MQKSILFVFAMAVTTVLATSCADDVPAKLTQTPPQVHHELFAEIMVPVDFLHPDWAKIIVEFSGEVDEYTVNLIMPGYVDQKKGSIDKDDSKIIFWNPELTPDTPYWVTLTAKRGEQLIERWKTFRTPAANQPPTPSRLTATITVKPEYPTRDGGFFLVETNLPSEIVKIEALGNGEAGWGYYYTPLQGDYLKLFALHDLLPGTTCTILVTVKAKDSDEQAEAIGSLTTLSDSQTDNTDGGEPTTTPDAGTPDTTDGGQHTTPDAGSPTDPTGPARLKISLVENRAHTPMTDRTIGIGATHVPMISFKLEAEGGPVKVNYMQLRADGNIRTSGDLKNIRLYMEGASTPFAQNSFLQLLSDNTMQFTLTATDNLLPDVLIPGTPAVIQIRADIGGPDEAALGDVLRFFIESEGSGAVGGRDVMSGQFIRATGSAKVVFPTIIVPFDVQVTGENPTYSSLVTQAVVANTQIARVKIQNTGSSPIEIRQVTFADHGSHHGTPTYRLYYSNQNEPSYMANIADTETGSPAFSSLATYFTINGGSYRYLTVAITQLGGAESGDSWRLSIDDFNWVKYAVFDADLGYDALLDGSFNNMAMLPGNGAPILGTIVKQ